MWHLISWAHRSKCNCSTRSRAKGEGRQPDAAVPSTRSLAALFMLPLPQSLSFAETLGPPVEQRGRANHNEIVGLPMTGMPAHRAFDESGRQDWRSTNLVA